MDNSVCPRAPKAQQWVLQHKPHGNSPTLGGKSINKAGLHPASLTPRLFPPQETRLNCIRIARKGKLPAFSQIPAPAA